ncbi:MAG: permease-like cell division protein FtsX [Deltaproteobacteria bacterium]
MRLGPAGPSHPAFYYLRRALDSARATPLVTSVTVTSIAVSVLFAGAILLVGSNAYRLVVHWGSQGVDVSVYLRAGLDDSAVVGLRQRIAADTDTVAVSYVSQEEAWQFLADNLGDSAELLDGLEPSVLPASLEISLATVVDEGRLRAKLERWRAMPEVADIQYNHAWTERLSNAMGVIRWVAWALGALALMASAVIVGATFQLAAFTRREEMEVMRLVGAVGPVYWAPVLLGGAIQGLLGSLLALATLALVFGLAAGPLSEEVPIVASTLGFLAFGQCLTLVLWGGGLGAAGSWLGMQRSGSWR